MMQKQIIAALIVIVAVTGLGFAMTPASNRAQNTALDNSASIKPSAYKNIIVFNGVAVKNNEVKHAAFLAMDGNNIKNIYDYRYFFIVIDGKMTPLIYKESTYDQQTQTLLITFSDTSAQASEKNTFIVRWYKGSALMSGDFDGYELNMNLIGYKPWVKPKPAQVPEYSEDESGSDMSPDDAATIAQDTAEDIE